MGTHIEIVERIGLEQTERRVWVFTYHEHQHALVLSNYREESRPTRRHGWRKVQHYSRIFERESSIKVAPAIPDYIAADASRQFTSTLRVLSGVPR